MSIGSSDMPVRFLPSTFPNDKQASGDRTADETAEDELTRNKAYLSNAGGNMDQDHATVDFVHIDARLRNPPQ
jgi:hypothetical protein